MIIRRYGIAATLLLSVLAVSSQGARQSNISNRAGGLLKGVSDKRLIETARDHNWSIRSFKSRPDTINIIAIRAEFKRDTSLMTTGNGLFGIRWGGDKTETGFYDTDTIYRYDDLPHDSVYFARQLDAVKKYFSKVSRGKLTLEYSIYPSGRGETGYAVDTTMPFYSPGGKKRTETYDEYYERRAIGHITFVRDAIMAADAAGEKSPFTKLHYDSTDNTIRDEQGRKTVFLIFHAGSSGLTDTYGDTQSDMIDAFYTPNDFMYMRDTLKLPENGIRVKGNGGTLLIDEVMTCSETSNQDSINWGIQGIIVNQIGRQLGIPDLYTTSNGTSGIGSFCIMDFAGYSAGNGFIPPYPSAWVRAFMGWDNPYSVSIGDAGLHSVKALTSVLDRDTSQFIDAGDTTTLLVPINDHEYYLIENRQRNLSGDRELFQYDTVELNGRDTLTIRSYPFVANLDKNVLASSGTGESNVIQRVRNNDVGLPASGLLVWHIDEKVIRDRMEYNQVNADSTFRGVSLVEADGITDLGVTFQNVMYQAVYDYGGAEDVFPHRTKIEDDDTVINITGFGPMTKPSTRANDGGHTWLQLDFSWSQTKPRTETTALGKNDGYHFVTNYSDSLFTVKVSWNYLVSSWPKRAAPGRFHEPIMHDIDKSVSGKELLLLDETGRVYLWSSTPAKEYNSIAVPVDRVTLERDTLHDVDTVYCFDSIPGACAMPSAIHGTVFIPSSDKKIHLYTYDADAKTPRRSSLDLSLQPSTYVCGYHDSSWAMGCSDGHVIFGKMGDTVSSFLLSSASPVCALAALRESATTVVAAQHNGRLSVVDAQSDTVFASIMLPEAAIGPFTLVTGDLDKARDSSSEIVVTDSRHGMWVYGRDLKLSEGWSEESNDWPAYYRSDTTQQRSRFPVNLAPPALADLDRDGYLDIIVGGTNGLYAFNHKGAMKSGWPAFMDKRSTHWYTRGSVVSSPVVVTDNKRLPLTLYSTTTGDNLTYNFTKVTKADLKKGIIWFRLETGVIDSVTDLTAAQLDTILDMSDSIIGVNTIPGGLVDAVGADAKRPRSVVAGAIQSSWPLTAGSPLYTSPLVGFMDADTVPDLVAVSSQGWVYRWELAARILPDSLFWPQTGYDNGRSFAYGGSTLQSLVSETEPIVFFSFPNPARGADKVTFKYKFSAPAKAVRLDIYSYTGFKVYSNATMGAQPRNLSGSYPDWNLLTVPIRGIGPGVYRCRLEAVVEGKKRHSIWKMAVIK